MSALLTKIGQLAIFLICAQTLVHFRPKDSYEKYIKLLVSMMLLILLVEPVMDLLGKENKGAFLDRIHVYEQELQEILISPQLETAQIEVILQNITQQKVEEGTVYVQGQERVEVETPEDNVSVEKSTGQSVSNMTVKEETTEAIEVQVKIEEIQEVKIGAGDGKSENNH